MTAIAVVPGWVKVQVGEQTGYVSHKYIATDKKIIEQIQAQQIFADASHDETSESDYTYENAVVSVQNYDDYDGSGHGYREITYEDGSTEIEEY